MDLTPSGSVAAAGLVGALGLSVGGIILLAGMSHPVPDVLTHLATGALGGLAGLAVPTTVRALGAQPAAAQLPPSPLRSAPPPPPTQQVTGQA